MYRHILESGVVKHFELLEVHVHALYLYAYRGDELVPLFLCRGAVSDEADDHLVRDLLVIRLQVASVHDDSFSRNEEVQNTRNAKKILVMLRARNAKSCMNDGPIRNGRCDLILQSRGVRFSRIHDTLSDPVGEVV